MSFKEVEINRPRRSVFDNSYYIQMDCEMGKIIPVFGTLCLPGDHYKIAVEALIRAHPLIAPLMHRIDMKVDYFYVPLRNLWPKPDYVDLNGDPLNYPQDVGSWEQFITGGVKGAWKASENIVHPKKIPSNTAPHSLWDYFGFPVGVAKSVSPWLYRAYNMCYNEFYRPVDYFNPVDLDSEVLHKSCYEKDYFTSALWDTQRGTAPSLPISGMASAIFDGGIGQTIQGELPILGRVRNWNTNAQRDVDVHSSSSYRIETTNITNPAMNPNGDEWVNYALRSQRINTSQALKDWLNNNHIDLTNLGLFTANDLREMFAIQKNLERSMRSGSRYTESLLSHWGVHNGDSRLQRPEYIGGVRSPIIISEVLQTSQTNAGNPQGNMAGHGISSASDYVGSYYCKDYGVIIGLMRLMPKPSYQQGINRMWLYNSRFEYPTPELVNLGEQEIYNMELVATGNDTHDKGIFGFQERYSEHRVRQNQVAGTLRSAHPQSMQHWHLARNFSLSAPPVLNKEFLEITDDRRYAAVQNQPSWIVTFGNRVRRVAPLPISGRPGYLDHN